MHFNRNSKEKKRVRLMRYHIIHPPLSVFVNLPAPSTEDDIEDAETAENDNGRLKPSNQSTKSCSCIYVLTLSSTLHLNSSQPQS